MEEFNIQGKQISFYKYCPGTFGYILVCVLKQKAISLSSPSFSSNRFYWPVLVFCLLFGSPTLDRLSRVRREATVLAVWNVLLDLLATDNFFCVVVSKKTIL
jgi:hypothetical protein